MTVLFSLEHYYFAPIFLKRYERTSTLTDDTKDNQYLFTERNTSKYMNTTIVWPKSLHESKYKEKPVLFCLVPHGIAPLGATAYPMWSKVWSSRLCHWTCAPVILQLPYVGYFMDKIGYIPAKAKPMLETLQKKEESVGVFLDGIDGMFQSPKEERAVLKKRKGVVKIALRAGVPIIPVYAFGHTAAYTVWVDPFGILKTISLILQTSLTPFFGRYGWFLGPPKRVPITICLGEPIECPLTAEPSQELINKYHAKMLQGFQATFDKHKKAYGWEKKELKIV
jgi:1-acyl-sn-glycerol-3-phosphate acyltransferase